MNLKTYFIDQISGWKQTNYYLFYLCLGCQLMILLTQHLSALSLITFIGTITGILCLGSLNSARQICGYFGTISCLCFAYIAFKAHNFLNLFTYLINMGVMYLPIIFNPQWTKKDNIKKLGRQQWITIFILYCIIFIVLGNTIQLLSNDPRPWLDALTLTIDIFGSILCCFKYRDQYLFWLILNFCNVILWLFSFIQGDATISIAVNYIIYLISTFIGIFNSPWFGHQK